MLVHAVGATARPGSRSCEAAIGAGPATRESAHTDGGYAVEHTWAALDIDLSEDGEVTILGIMRCPAHPEREGASESGA